MDTIKVGVIGVGRGQGFARGAGPLVGMELVALCDTWEEKLNELGKELGVATYTDYDKFLEHDMDAVILANYFHEHAPFAIKALKADKHVMSETSACFTLGEGVELVETVEQTGKAYMFAENYPYMLFNQEMRRLYEEGAIGQFTYGEGEYVHPGERDWALRLKNSFKHWRNWFPRTYYCTHALGPIMFITDTRPVSVNGFMITRPDTPESRQYNIQMGDLASMIAVRMDNGAVAKLLQGGLQGHSVWVRIHGLTGQMENLRHGDHNMVRLTKHQFNEPKTEPVESIYKPNWPVHAEEAEKAGHGGGDFFTTYHFAEAIRTGEPPYLDVYRGVAMSIVGIQAYRSALDSANNYEVPDFRDKAMRDKYRDDDWNPNPVTKRETDPWPSVTGKIVPTPEAIAYARKVWKEAGYPPVEDDLY
jgi:predicted dehydrogenase